MFRVCIHLNQKSDGDYAHYFTGDGIGHALICLLCQDNPESIEGNLYLVSPERFAQIEENGFWEWIRTPFWANWKSGSVHNARLQSQRGYSDRVVPDEIAALHPIPADADGKCLLLTVDGTLFRVESASRLVRPADELG